MPTAATVYISESNLVGEVVTDNISNINFGSVDAPNIVAASHPVIVSERSFNKYHRFKVASLGDSTTIKDLRWWKSAGVFVTGETSQIRDFGTSGAIAYATPSSTLSLAGWPNLRTSDPGTATVDIGGSLSGEFTVPGYSGYFNSIIVTTLSTPVGPANTKTITFQYDET